MSSAPENITCLSLDYHNDEDVKLAIKSTIKKNGPITLVVAWYTQVQSMHYQIFVKN